MGFLISTCLPCWQGHSSRSQAERAFYYDEKINRLTFIGTDVSWEIIRLTPHAIEFLQHGDNLWSPFDWYYFRRSPEKELKAD